jgi:hypothetical protein
VTYAPSGEPDTDHDYDVGILCVAEQPYAEGPGDNPQPTVRDEDHARFSRMRSRCQTLIVIVYSGRPVAIPEILKRADAVIAAWLPGSEATELPELLFGRAEFEGRLPQPWPDAVEAENAAHRNPSSDRRSVANNLKEIR